MKIYFTASLTGKQFYRKNYERIFEGLVESGNDVSELAMTDEAAEVARHTREQHVKAHQKIRGMIRACDLVVAETSYSSIAVGYEITTALSMSKKVLLLHLPGKYSPLLEGVRDPNLTIVEYTEDNLETKLVDALKAIEKNADVRFNFFIPKSLLAHLDWAVVNQRINRSEYIRGLIEKDRKRNKRYRKD